MEPIVAKCGYRCDLCLFFEAHLAGGPGPDRISEAFARYCDCQLAPEAIRPCKGCQGRDEAPDKDCRVYPCVRERGLQNCGQCPEFGCETLKTRMDAVEKCLAKHPDVSEEDYRLFFGPYLSRAALTEIHRAARD